MVKHIQGPAITNLKYTPLRLPNLQKVAFTHPCTPPLPPNHLPPQLFPAHPAIVPRARRRASSLPPPPPPSRVCETGARAARQGETDSAARDFHIAARLCNSRIIARASLCGGRAPASLCRGRAAVIFGERAPRLADRQARSRSRRRGGRKNPALKFRRLRGFLAGVSLRYGRSVFRFACGDPPAAPGPRGAAVTPRCGVVEVVLKNGPAGASTCSGARAWRAEALTGGWRARDSSG